MKPESNPCAGRRAAVMELASGVRAIEAADAVRRHVDNCPHCRAYLAAISEVCETQVQAARRLAEAELSTNARRKIASAIRRRPRTVPDRFWLVATAWRWPIGAGVGFALVLLFGWLGWFLAPQSGSISVRQVSRFTGAAMARSNATPVVPVPFESPGPTLLAYQQALKRSPEALDLLLAREALRPMGDSVVPLRLNSRWVE